MNADRREIVFQRWSGEIRRETRDLASLKRIGMRALGDLEVRNDPRVDAMIRTLLEEHQAKLEQKLQYQKSSTSPGELTPSWRSETPGSAREEFYRLAQEICQSLEDGDENATHAAVGRMRAFQEQNPEDISASTIEEYEQRVEKLRVHIKQLSDETAVHAKQAVLASRDGNEQEIARSMRRLTAIHAAHPRLLDEAGLEEIRGAVARAADERRQHQLTTKKLLDRERAITAEIRRLAAAVRDFHQVACKVSEASEEFRVAEAKYVRAIDEVRTYDTEWFSGVVLDLADLLAEWTVPPMGAEGQIDRFLDSISRGLKNIRVEMHDIQAEKDSDEGAAS